MIETGDGVDAITSDWIQNEADKIAVANRCYFDLEAATHARTFVESFLYLSPRKPFHLLDWQWRKVIAPLFGWKRRDCTRRFRVAYIEIPKKNGKSVLCSAIALYLLVADGEYSAEVYNAAYSRDQAGIVFREAAKLVRGSPELAGQLEVIDSTKSITFKHTQSFLRVLSRDAHSAEGKNIHGLVFDEVHSQKTRDLWDALRYGGAARKQPLIVGITTAGFDKLSICWELHEQAVKVIAGITPQDDFYGYIAAAEPTDDWKIEGTWKKANPSYGVTLSPQDFASECLEAQQSPAKENAFRRYRLNQWTEQETRFVNLDAWKACHVDYTEADLLGRECYAGVDLSISTDVTATVLVFPFSDGTFKILCRFYLPSETIKEMRGRLPYDVWRQAGHITQIEGNVIDYDLVRADIRELGKKYSIKQIAFDPYNAQNFETQLIADGFKAIKFPQNMGAMSPVTKEFERLILKRQVQHNSNPVLDWMMSCVTVQTDAQGNIKPVKPDRMHSTNKIDGVVALIMALGVSIHSSNTASAKQKSIYETRPLLVF